jgi:hypothetical protein
VALKLGFLKTRCTEDKRSAPLFHRIITELASTPRRSPGFNYLSGVERIAAGHLIAELGVGRGALCEWVESQPWGIVKARASVCKDLIPMSRVCNGAQDPGDGTERRLRRQTPWKDFLPGPSASHHRDDGCHRGAGKRLCSGI